MNKTLRPAVIAGNWKMNKTAAETKATIEALAPLCANMNGCKVVLCVPYTDIAAAVAASAGTNIEIGAQNVHFKKNGAYTGEISADMLVECGIKYVITGHSERRQYFAETDETVNLRTKAALESGLNVIVCVGEVLSQRDAGITDEILAMQTKLDLSGITEEQLKHIIIAYEPVWAIGTGRVATPDQAEDACAVIRRTVAELYGEAAADALTIQYGGSMNNENAAELLAKPDVDGGLIGGASLVPQKFAAIIEAAQ